MVIVLERPGAPGAPGLLVFARILCVAAATVMVSGCIPLVHRGEIGRDRAIEIARAQVSFQPDNVVAQRTGSGGRAVWRITFRGRLPNQPPLLFETIIVEVDRRSGEVVSVARS